MRSMSEEERRYSSEAEEMTAGARQTREERGADKRRERRQEKTPYRRQHKRSGHKASED
jgi:hypothetical protein